MTLDGFGYAINAISAEGAITSFNIANGTILGTDISDATISGSKIAEGTITSFNIEDGTISEAKLDASLNSLINAGGGSVPEGSITSFHIATGSILGTDISGATITGSNIAVETITSSNIANGTILTVDISDGAITQAKLHIDIQTYLADIGQSLYNLEYPGFWGTFKFINSNSSDQGAELIITAEKRYHNPVNNTYQTQLILHPPETITKGSHHTITIPISERLINDVTIIRMYYTINKAHIEVVSNEIFEENDKSSDVNGNYYDFILDGNYEERNGGNAEIGFIIADNIVIN